MKKIMFAILALMLVGCRMEYSSTSAASAKDESTPTCVMRNGTPKFSDNYVYSHKLLDFKEYLYLPISISASAASPIGIADEFNSMMVDINHHLLCNPNSKLARWETVEEPRDTVSGYKFYFETINIVAPLPEAEKFQEVR
jgi:hypothetical protein